MDADEKAYIVVNRVIDAVEDACNNVVDTEDWDVKMIALQLICGVALSAHLKHKGWFRFLRTVLGSIILRYRFPDLLNVD